MQLKIHNEGWVYFVISCLITIIIIPFYTILGIFLCILSAYIFYFFRDPIRAIPNEDVVVSPADGLVTFVGSAQSPLSSNLDKHNYTKNFRLKKEMVPMSVLFLSPMTPNPTLDFDF